MKNMNSNDTQQSAEELKRNRKAARKTALILAVVALGVFSWSIYMVIYHATK